MAAVRLVTVSSQDCGARFQRAGVRRARLETCPTVALRYSQCPGLLREATSAACSFSQRARRTQ